MDNPNDTATGKEGKSKHEHRLPYIPKHLELNLGIGHMVSAICPDDGQQFVYELPPIGGER